MMIGFLAPCSPRLASHSSDTYVAAVKKTDPDTEPRLLTIQELSDWLQVPVATIYQWRHQGKGPNGVRVGRYVRYRRVDVDEWINHHLESHF